MRKTSTFLIIAGLALCLFVYGCATAPEVRLPEGQILLTDLCAEYGVEWHWDSVTQLVTLRKQDHIAKGLVGSSTIAVDNNRIVLSAPMRRYRGAIIVPKDFRQKVFNPLNQQELQVKVKFRTIVLDPGHGGKDPGAIGVTGLQEKEVNLDIARRLEKNLTANGINVYMTRDDDSFIPLEDRAKIAHEKKADLFVSIHANSNRSKKLSGLEVYYSRDLSDRAYDEMYSANKYDDVFKSFSISNSSSVVHKILVDMMRDYRGTESGRLADYLAYNTSRDVQLENRGSHKAGFAVLKNTLIPAVLVEVGFLSNKNEETKLKSNWFRQKIADSLSKSIENYGK